MAEEVGVLKIKWNAPYSFLLKGKTITSLSFDGAAYEAEKNNLPYLLLKEVCTQGVKLQPVVQPVLTQSLSTQEEAAINKADITPNFEIAETTVGTAKKVTYMFCKLVPIRINKATGRLEKLVSYRLQWQPTSEALQSSQRNANQVNKTQGFTSSSVLGSGTWYKIGTAQNAVYKIDKPLLQHILGNGIDVSSINPKNIKIYGNGGEILSEANSAFHYDDLTENAIFVSDSDGVFDNNDYILFYGQSPHKWKYSAGSAATTTRYTRTKHYYSDSVFYFLTIDNSSPGKRIAIQLSSLSPATNVVNSFDDYQVHENDATNLVASGREFYGENYDNTASYSFGFAFPNLQNDTIWVKTDLIGRRVQPAGSGAFDVNYLPGAGNSYQLGFGSVCPAFDCDVGAQATGSKYFVYNNAASNNPISISVSRTYPDETGWLNYIWVIVRRALTMQGNQMGFRDYRCIGTNAVSQFNLQSSLTTVQIWDVTDQFNISQQQTTFNANNYSFTVATDSLKQFIAFDGNSFETPAFVGLVNDNINLHSKRNYSYVVIAPQSFKNQAEQLITLHADPHNENLTGIVVTPDQIYNEFSSGVQDVTAIRQFVRMLYTQSTTPPQYLLLYGTGSYRQKDRYAPSNTVFVPAFETVNSWSYLYSLTSDDFFAYLDDNEGVIGVNGTSGGLVDIGVGRLPVKNTAEATGVANKIVQYYNRVEPTSSCCDQATQNTPDWRNWVCLIADDVNPGSANTWELDFFSQQEGNAAIIQGNQRYNVDKIYEDAYQVEAVPGGRRYPDVVTAINNRVAKGALIIGYSGHGGTLNLAHEEIITIPQIEQWNNINNMPLFFTATCAFSTYDDPDFESAGEDIVLNSKGGGIGSFTTTRTATVQDGYTLGPYFYPAALDSLVTGRRPTLGDIIRITKLSAQNELNFTLLGDPAVTLSYPKQYTGSAITVNTHTYVQGGANDTLSALGKYTITGFVSDIAGNKLNNFNGSIYITVFDKPNQLSLLDNAGDGAAFRDTFRLQKSVLYKGKSTVTNGNFTYTFIVPKDIMYNFGYGKISYYAQPQVATDDDAGGYFTQVIVGGTSNTPIIDNQGPGINLYMNDNHFVTGGITNQNPFIYALLSDSSGINTSGTGLGHDVVAILDANTPHEIVLNDYYQADQNKYQSGKILYQLSSLSNGNHTLSMKVWDVADNSSTAQTDFVVAQNAQMALTHVLNYPNPFTTATKFYVEHNQSCDFLNIEVQIYTITGKVVKTILQTVENQGFRTDGINWDGRDDYGDKLARGVYIYKVTVKNSEGSKADKIEKLVILN